jgi:hypothetical protein
VQRYPCISRPLLCGEMLSALPPKSPLVLFFQARFEYLSCVHKGPKDELPEKLKVDSKQAILKQLASARIISMQDAIALTNMLDDSKLPEDAAADIRQAIQAKADIQGDATPASSAQKIRQEHQHLEHYQSASDWKVYASDAQHCVKIAHMTKRMHSLFLYYPTEPTISGAVAIALHADGPHEPIYVLAKVRQLKEFLQSGLKAHGAVFTADLPKVYPAHVDTFKDTDPVMFGAAFATELPATSPVPVLMMQILKSGAPCRKTKLGCNELAGPVVKQNGRSQAIVNSMLQHQHSEVQLPGFRWCNGSNSFPPAQINQGAITAGHLQSAPSYLALGDMPASVVQPHQPVPAEANSQALTPAKDTSAIAAVGGTPPATAIEHGVAKVSDLVAKFQQRAAESKAAAAKARDDADDDVGSICDTERPAMKRPAAASKPEPAAKKSKPEAATKKSDTILKSKPKGEPHNKSELLYKAGASGPRYYNSATVYTDTKNNMWRVKPCPGVRVEKKFAWKSESSDNRDQWAKLVAHVKSLPQM